MKKRKLGRKSGKIQVVLTIDLLVILMIMVMVYLQIEQFKTTRAYMEDALAASNLASAVIDIEEFGTTNNIVIASSDDAFAIYKDAIRYNLNLDDAWECPNKALISGPVRILTYIIYNVRDQDVEIYTYDENGSVTHQVISNGLGTVTSPNGIIIENTSIYSRIGFPVEAIWGIQVDAVKDNLADIVQNN